ncbi:MAG: biotin synthase BioB [Sphingomonadaceae bacterium]|nr:biotin synthase BioB [Sphingomonadaceae bacterium]
MPSWIRAEVAALFDLPFTELMFRAMQVHRAHHDPATIERAQLLSIKTGGCPEDCGYCAQSARFETGVKAGKLMDISAVLAAARAAKAGGATRFCMGAAWRSPKDRDLPALEAIIAGVKALSLETCMTLGMLTPEQGRRLADAGLDYYNHNLDTSEAHYDTVVTTRSYAERLETLRIVRESGMATCCGGILGLGETREDRVDLVHTLATLPEPPQSVPLNALMPQPGTPLADAAPVDGIEFVRTVAAARITMPRAVIRLSAGREAMSDELQALAFLAGANSIFAGDRLLTAANPGLDRDAALFGKLGLRTACLPAAPQHIAASEGAAA